MENLSTSWVIRQSKKLRAYWAENNKSKWPLALLCIFSLLLWWYVEVIRDWNHFSIRQVYPRVPPYGYDKAPEHGFQSLYFLVEGVGDPYARLQYVQEFALSRRDSWAPLLMEKRRDGLRTMIYFIRGDLSGDQFYDYFGNEYICIYKGGQYRAGHIPCLDEMFRTISQFKRKQSNFLWPLRND